MKRSRRLVQITTMLSLAVAAACSKDSTEPGLPDGVLALRAALAPYTSLAIAKQGGYNTAITDCMSNGDEGAMGIHYAKTDLLDSKSDSLHPEALIYEPGTDGEASLVGVEFIIPFSAVSEQSPAPTLFGQRFTPNEVFGVWGLHVWTHRINPSGTFAMWNPRVHC
jgi:hypothetical protein